MTDKPEFHLNRVSEGTSEEEPQVISVNAPSADVKLNRRALGRGVGLSTALLLLKGRKASAQTSDNGVPSTFVNAHRSRITSLAIGLDNITLVTASLDERTKIWSLPSGFGATCSGTGGVNAARIKNTSPARVITASRSETRHWSIAGVSQGTLSYGIITAMALTTAETALVAGYEDATVKVWAYPNTTQTANLTGHKAAVRAIAVSPDGSTYFSGSRDRTVRLWSASSGSSIAVLQGHTGDVQALAVSPDGTLLASGSQDNTVNLWSLPSGRLLTTLKGHTRGSNLFAPGGVTSLAITPDGRLLASGAWDSTINLWSLPDGRLLATLRGHQAGVTALAIALDGNTLVSGDAIGVVIVWDIAQRRFRSFVYDRAANVSTQQSQTYTTIVSGRTVTYTLPCGSAIPAGATCTCNCVGGTYTVPSGGGTSGG
ncbi:MAG: WD40 repeat domain-containing protein, partial [Acidobacteria bacterium]|nr:WD40 repeat domain-containing protein [Acidobacteriota bacterium]